jgi:spermidine synthase
VLNFTPSGLVCLYGVAIFVSAALLFTVQPMVAKMILPYLGGSSAVWSTALFFFQSVLLLGYLYAHLTSSWLGIRRQSVLHLVIALVSLLLLPISIPEDWLSRPNIVPVLLVLSVLCVSAGGPFFVLSASSPLLQRWFAGTADAGAKDPYFLYAASNAGSLAGLIAYPLLLEPNLSIPDQSRVWSQGYIGLLVLTVACSFAVWRSLTRESRRSVLSNTAGADDVTMGRRMRWLAWSFAPSSLLLGVTSYLTTDIASVPLFWILPLALYLLSFVFAFQRSSWAAHPFVVRRQGFLLLAAAITVFAKATNPAWILLPLHLVAFFVTALVCHGQLANDRPDPKYLTEYFLLISCGGVLGGVFNALLAPVLFNDVVEYPLAMVVAALMRPYLVFTQSGRRRWLDLVLPLLVGVSVAGLVYLLRTSTVLPERFAHVLILGFPAVVVLSFAYRPIRFGLGILALMAGLSGYHEQYGRALYAERSFFGVYRVVLDKDQKRHVIFHGTTAHGSQSVDPFRRLESISYYHRTGPAGQVFTVLSQSGYEGRVALIGLGAGSLACYGKAGQEFVFYELDPVVERIARNPRLFTYLRDCPPNVSVTIGDARVSLAKAPDRHYGLIVLDAFSSDAIPIHLLTREALQLYLSKLQAQGLLLFHISNRYFDLPVVLDKLASRLNLAALIQQDVQITEAEQASGKSPSIWVLMAPEKQTLAPFVVDTRWKPLVGELSGDLWTDDYSNVVRVLRLK